jgi:excisionase family DNA binding protein
MENLVFTQLSIPEVKLLFRQELEAYFSGNKPIAQTPPEPQERWFNLDELCNYLPNKPAKQTIYGKVSSKEIPYYKDQKTLRFLKSEIDNWLKQGRKKTSIEIQAEIEDNTDAFLSKRNQSSKN